jgi:hypothetical protein
VIDPDESSEHNYLEEVGGELQELGFQTNTLVVPLLYKGYKAREEELRYWNHKGVSILSMLSERVGYKLANDLDRVCLFQYDGTFGPATHGAAQQNGIFGLGAGTARTQYNDSGNSTSTAGDSYATDATNVQKDFLQALEEWIGDGFPKPTTVTMLCDPKTDVWMNSLQKTYGNFTGTEVLKRTAKEMGVTLRGPFTSKHCHTSSTSVNTSVDSDRITTTAADGTGCIAYIHDKVAGVKMVNSMPLKIETRWSNEQKMWVVEGYLRSALMIENGQGIVILDDVDMTG